MSIRLNDVLIWCYWHPFRRIVQAAPRRLAYLLARWGGSAAYYVFRQRRRALAQELTDLGLAGPGNPELKRTVKRAFSVLFQNEIDVMLFPKLNAANIGDFVVCSGTQYIDEALQKGKGVMLLFTHFGANQMIMPAIGYRGYTMCQMSAPPMVWEEKLPNKKFTPMGRKALQLRWEHELSLPVKHINIFRPLKEAFVCLRKNQILGIAMDGGGGKERVAVGFLGRTALISGGAIEIAMRTGCVVLPTFMVRQPRGDQKLIVQEPLQLSDAGDHEERVQKNVALFMGRFEEYVRTYPDHYLNFLALRRFMELQGDAPFFKKENRKI